MAMTLSYREIQLIRAFRACDERGKRRVEDMAAFNRDWLLQPIPAPVGPAADGTPQRKAVLQLLK